MADAVDRGESLWHGPPNLLEGPMARLLDPGCTFDTLEDEVAFTQAALEADDDARPFLSYTESWFPRIDAARLADRGVRLADAKAEARRVVANGGLDEACTRFGRELRFDLDDRLDHPRWTTFFDLAVSRFVRRALADQAARVRAWLKGTDPVLEKHRPALETWVGRTEQALADTRALYTARGENWGRREELCADLTRERDALEDLLAEKGRELGRDRDWAKLFFRKTPRREGPPEALPPEPEPSLG